MEFVEVRPRTAADLEAAVRALRGVHERDGYPMVWPPDPAAWLSPPGLQAAWVALENHELLGHVATVRNSAQLVSVTRLFVAPAARGRGLRLGARLLETAIEWADENACRLMLDVVDDGGPAIALYERLGWELVDRRTADWQTPDGRRLPVRIYRAPRG